METPTVSADGGTPNIMTFLTPQTQIQPSRERTFSLTDPRFDGIDVTVIPLYHPIEAEKNALHN